ncbi:MAG TPA: hypothetical protein VF747_13120 [Blastocatellia bacterium]|jgi:hypothetical protein
MRNRIRSRRTPLPAILLTLVALAATTPSALAASKFDGRWAITITIPESPTSSNKRTFTINLDVSPRGGSLHGRMTITDAEGRTTGGAWRQSSKKIAFSYELPCSGEEATPCATLLLKGKMKSSNTKFKGDVIVMWDSANSNNPALYDTSNGSFSGERLP